MSDGFDVVVVGAGAVGLACAAALGRAGRSVLVLEQHGGIGRETTSRNSEVIHAGLYYPPGSLKAGLCVEGRERIYERCRREGLPHRQTGKLVVATEPEEHDALERLRLRGTENGAPGLRLLGSAELSRLEPAVRGVAALLSPRTGICDARSLCLSWAAEAERHGAELLLASRLEVVEREAGGYRLQVRVAGKAERARCAAVVNAAGLEADRVAEAAGLDPDALGYRLHPCKGDYFRIAPAAPLRVEHLVYPLPAGPGLGIHLTLDLGGGLRLGPDAEYVDEPGYQVDPRKAGRFAAAARRYLPALRAEWLTPDQAGLRPRLAAPGEAFRDFVVEEESARGLPGFVDLVGIESPGLTAAPAIGERVARMLASL